MTNKTNISKFSFGEMTSNSNGKTSMSGVVGLILCLTGALCFTIGVAAFLFLKNKEGLESVLLQSLALATLGTSMILTKKLKPTKDSTNSEELN